ncbi:hypothetical protein BV898_12062 [Hypsibius exemplaris]|uniref:CUB domain-containing protein n=1 Tax=Hypsibius exemplaris TaxID=2072580 RepID=A0A1W0WEZ5_HYPEX|nr:hypothetical protein BV898_12062 [Hypsibius exemplaris]
MIGHVALSFAFIGVVHSQSPPDACKTPLVINATTGTFSTPFYQFHPEFTYKPESKCRWTINVPDGKFCRRKYFFRFKQLTPGTRSDQI